MDRRQTHIYINRKRDRDEGQRETNRKIETDSQRQTDRDTYSPIQTFMQADTET